MVAAICCCIKQNVCMSAFWALWVFPPVLYGPGSDYCNLPRFSVWKYGRRMEAYEASHNHDSGESPWLWTPFPKLTRRIKEEDTGNNLSVGQEPASPNNGPEEVFPPNSLLLSDAECAEYAVWGDDALWIAYTYKNTRDWTCCYACSSPRGEIRESIRGLSRIWDEDSTNTRKHNRALMESERPRRPYNSITV